MSAPADIERPTGLRLASQYKAIEKKGLEIPHYPRTLNPSSTSIHDLAYRQSILGNEDNLAEQTTSSIFHLMKPEAHDDELRYYIEARAKPSLNPLASTSNGLESNAPKRHSHRVSL